MDQKQLKKGLDGYVKHLEDVTRAFNEYAAVQGLRVRADATSAIHAVKAGIGLSRIASFWTRADDTGIVHESQLRTAIECMVELLKDQKRCGHVVGAMQSGKTTTSLALQWSGPVLYALTGTRAYPFYLIGNQTNHEDQTNTELDRFLAYYGNIEIKSVRAVKGFKLDAVFAHSPSLNNYREHVLRGMKDVFSVPHVEDIVHRRVGGEQSVKKIADACRRAVDQGYRPLIMIDEPQFGASDRFVTQDDGQRRQQPCVLVQIFDRIEQELGTTRQDHWFVGLSATPFELNDLQRVWEVRQHLTKDYSGFNYFNGKPISTDVEVSPPTTLSLAQFADEIEVPFVSRINMAVYDGSPAAFARHARRIGYQGDQVMYQADVVAALRTALNSLVDGYANKKGAPVGLCLRVFNDNAKTEALINRLALDPQRIEVIHYYGLHAGGQSVKRVIGNRQHPHLPYVIFVTNRARMADAFPVEVRFFMDFAQKANDLNALLQGLLGRACGYGKQSTVVLSDTNAVIVDAYVATQGGYVHRTSRHSITVGGFRRGAPTGMLKLRADMDDPVLKKFFDRINKQLVEAHIPEGSKLKVPRKRGGGFRMGPILRIAKAVRLFDHIELAQVRTALFPEIRTPFKVAREDDKIRHSRDPETFLGYSHDGAGSCRYTFRWSDRESAAQGGAAGRAKGSKDTGQHVEPTIYVEKYDPASGEVIADRADPKRSGKWRAFMVTFPLLEPVRETKAAKVAYPVPHSPYNDWMEPHEQETRDRAQAPQA